MNIGKSITPLPAHQTETADWGWLRNLRRGTVIVAVWAAMMATGCARLEETSSVDAVQGDADTHAGFVVRNMAMLNRFYAESYEPKPFVVDLDGGSAPIQTLIRPKAISAATGPLGVSGLSPTRQVKRLHQHVLSNYAFVPEPLAWRLPEETVSLGRGDCKNLSLLLISLLASVGLETRGAISHGHMWVEVRVEDHWRILELDGDQERGRIYRLPGFYDLPLYRIYPDRTEKRRRLAAPR